VNLRARLERAALRFQPGNPLAPASLFVFGFVTPSGESASVAFDNQHVTVFGSVRAAQYLVYGSEADLAALLDPDAPDRAALPGRLTMRPDYPFNNYLLSIFLNTFSLMVPDLDYTARRFDGPFPFPPRYPAAENPFRQRAPQDEPLPSFDTGALPELIADDYPLWPQMMRKAWELAFRNLRHPEPESGFIANFIDPAFNANVFLWDSCFMTMFGHYARHRFRFMGTLDNFYAKQHDDGFICREINSYSGKDLFQSHDPRSTGPNILAWTELHDYRYSRDTERLRAVFPVLMAYHSWWRDWRTHPDGSLWTCGWGSGMDNQTRIPDSEYHHRQWTWIDATMQQALSCKALLEIGRRIARDEFEAELEAEFAQLSTYIHDKLWDEQTSFFFDRAPDGTLSATKTIGAYWGLLAGVIAPERMARFIGHLVDPASFNRPHRIPTQAADSAIYNAHGGYWQGAVWSPTNYMVLCGLTERGRDALAHEIAVNHIEQVAQVFKDTGTLWENYAPEAAHPGKPASRDFVGWTGVSAITIPIEYGIGLRTGYDGADLQWDIRLAGRHGVLRYPLSSAGHADFVFEPPDCITVRTTHPLIIDIAAACRVQRLHLTVGEHQFYLPEELS
jgi:hypothetical protein